jgi:hypothetical protein
MLRLNLGFRLISLGREDEGQTLIDRAIELDPQLESRRPSEPSPAIARAQPLTVSPGAASLMRRRWNLLPNRSSGD